MRFDCSSHVVTPLTLKLNAQVRTQFSRFASRLKTHTQVQDSGVHPTNPPYRDFSCIRSHSTEVHPARRMHEPGGGPRVVVSTAAFHARVRGSVSGLGGLKKKVSSPSTWGSSVTERPQTTRARISNPVSGGQYHLIHLTILRRFSWLSLAYMCTKVA